MLYSGHLHKADTFFGTNGVRFIEIPLYPIIPPNCQIDIDLQYADDIRKILTGISAIAKMKDERPVKLAQRGLKINESKTEEYTIKRANCDNH